MKDNPNENKAKQDALQAMVEEAKQNRGAQSQVVTGILAALKATVADDVRRTAQQVSEAGNRKLATQLLQSVVHLCATRSQTVLNHLSTLNLVAQGAQLTEIQTIINQLVAITANPQEVTLQQNSKTLHQELQQAKQQITDWRDALDEDSKGAIRDVADVLEQSIDIALDSLSSYIQELDDLEKTSALSEKPEHGAPDSLSPSN